MTIPKVNSSRYCMATSAKASAGAWSSGSRYANKTVSSAILNVTRSSGLTVETTGRFRLATKPRILEGSAMDHSLDIKGGHTRRPLLVRHTEQRHLLC